VKSIYLYDDEIGRVDYIDHMGSDLTIVNSARVSFGVTKDELEERDKKLIKYLVDHRHTSTFEHNVVTFRFIVPMFVRSQHMRHRTWSYNEISRRYTDKDMQFYTPETFRTQHKTNRQASNLDKINPVIVPDLADFGEGTTASQTIKKHVIKSMYLFTSLCLKECVVSKRGWSYRKIFTRNTMGLAISITCLNLLAPFT
jgi:flavin-dependent thymidylate synthase